jgi:hypothetical protein
MHMLGHKHAARNHQKITSAHLLQDAHEARVSSLMVEQLLPSITTDGEEVKLPGVLIVVEFSRHGESSLTRMVKMCDSHPSKPRKDGAPRLVAGREGTMGAPPADYLEDHLILICPSGDRNSRQQKLHSW